MSGMSKAYSRDASLQPYEFPLIRVPKRVEKTGRLVAENDPKTLDLFYDGAVEFYKAFPRQYSTYADIGLRSMGRDLEFAVFFFETTHLCLERLRPLYRGPVLKAVSKLVDQDTHMAREFMLEAVALTENRLGRADADSLLIDYIHDPNSANIISHVIDRKKHSKQYAQRIQKLY